MQLKVWFRTNFSTNEYMEYNRIIIKYYMNFYINCWYHRNEITQNQEIQKQRIHEQYKSKQRKVLDSKFPQVKKYSIDKETNIEIKSNEYIRGWIMGLRKWQKMQRRFKERILEAL